MKFRTFKIALLSLMLPVLSACTFIDNIVAGIALNFAFQSNMLLNKVTTTGGEAEVTQYDPAPTSASNRGSLSYGVEGLVLPKSIETTQYGFHVLINFTLSFSEGAEELFYRQDYDPDEGGADFDFVAEILYPTGDAEKPENMENMGDYLSTDILIDFHNQIDRDVEITLTGKAGNKTKKQTYYLNLNTGAIDLPGDEPIDKDYALIIKQVNTETLLDVTIKKEDLLLGVEIPLQVMWLDATKEGDEESVIIRYEDDIDATYDVTLPSDVANPHPITVNETLIDYPVFIKLKTGEPLPLADLVVTFKAKINV